MPDTHPEIEVLPKKRRRAPAGNHNAYKHGLYSNPGIYSRQLKPGELKDASNLSTIVLGNEIVAMCYFIRRLIATSATSRQSFQSRLVKPAESGSFLILVFSVHSVVKGFFSFVFMPVTRMLAVLTW